MSKRLVESYQNLLPLESHCPICRRGFSDQNKPTDEHIIPSWLQQRLALRHRRLTLPNGILREYKSIRVPICRICNTQRFSQLENKITRAWDKCSSNGEGFYDESNNIHDEEFAFWFAKIFWLLARVGYESPDPKTRNDVTPNTVVPRELMPFITWLGLFVAIYSQKKSAWSCFRDDPADKKFYGPSFSLYRFRIDDQGQPSEHFDFHDHYIATGISMRLGDLGLICLYDDGLHANWMSHRYADLISSWVHPIQFSEIVGQMYYDQLLLHPSARDFTAFWNRDLRALVTCNHWLRRHDPYLMLNHDLDLYIESINRLLPQGCHPIERIGDHYTTYLRDANDRLWDVVNNKPRS